MFSGFIRIGMRALTREGTVSTDNAVAGHNLRKRMQSEHCAREDKGARYKSNWISTVCAADGANGSGFAHGRGLLRATVTQKMRRARARHLRIRSS